MRPEKLITIGQYSQGTYAHIAKGKLESSGIECVILDEHLISINWLYSNALGGVKLQVKSSDVERAKAILEEKEETKPEEIKKKDKNIIYCPKCDSDEIYFEKFDKKPVFMSWLLLGIPIPFIKRKLKCYNCGYQWKNKNIEPFHPPAHTRRQSGSSGR